MPGNVQLPVDVLTGEPAEEELLASEPTKVAPTSTAPPRKLTQEEKLEELVKDSADQEIEIMQLAEDNVKLRAENNLYLDEIDVLKDIIDGQQQQMESMADDVAPGTGVDGDLPGAQELQ